MVDLTPPGCQTDSSPRTMSTSSLTLLPPPPVRSVDSHRLLTSEARRRETALVRARWQQSRAPTMTSRLRLPPHSAPPISLLRKARPLDYGQEKRASACDEDKNSQFPHLEKELNKRNLAERPPYFVPVHVEPTTKEDYPTLPTSYSYVFFLQADKTEKARCKTAVKDRNRRFFVHPEWSSERVGWVRSQHKSNPERFRFSWM